ncbi:hypothetical protein BJ138DRAFT_1098197 [Hygrophoropsis aurantiaca]|uniref:Uncharacterized protein n=1 Tax=Hygrophoropsis aurantiaca TaxID=72124 RepID=A0ACB8AQ83_9AGAM|nr:hypothetical protein BJ138DRAFT_1098197 [Hygrophoropsis aurantiaca]
MTVDSVSVAEEEQAHWAKKKRRRCCRARTTPHPPSIERYKRKEGFEGSVFQPEDPGTKKLRAFLRKLDEPNMNNLLHALQAGGICNDKEFYAISQWKNEELVEFLKELEDFAVFSEECVGAAEGRVWWVVLDFGKDYWV